MTFATEMADLAADVSDRLTVSVTLRAPATGSLNTTTGERVGPEEEHAVSAVRANEDVASGGVATARRVYHVAITALEATPLRGWQVADGDETYEVVAVEQDCGGAMWKLTTARSA